MSGFESPRGREFQTFISQVSVETTNKLRIRTTKILHGRHLISHFLITVAHKVHYIRNTIGRADHSQILFLLLLTVGIPFIKECPIRPFTGFGEIILRITGLRVYACHLPTINTSGFLSDNINDTTHTDIWFNGILIGIIIIKWFLYHIFVSGNVESGTKSPVIIIHPFNVSIKFQSLIFNNTTISFHRSPSGRSGNFQILKNIFRFIEIIV